MHETHKQTHSSENFAVKEVVGPVHSAQDPLTDEIPHEMRFSIENKKGKHKCSTVETQSKLIILWL